MQRHERFLTRRVGRFNYWEFFRPDGVNVVRPLKLHIKNQFNLILEASSPVWDIEIFLGCIKGYLKSPIDVFSRLKAMSWMIRSGIKIRMRGQLTDVCHHCSRSAFSNYQRESGTIAETN
jgi:hypothetical protein